LLWRQERAAFEEELSLLGAGLGLGFVDTQDPMRPLSPDTAAMLGLPPGCGMLEAVERLSSAPSAAGIADPPSGIPSWDDSGPGRAGARSYSLSAFGDFGVGLHVTGEKVSTAAAVAMLGAEVAEEERRFASSGSERGAAPMAMPSGFTPGLEAHSEASYLDWVADAQLDRA